MKDKIIFYKNKLFLSLTGIYGIIILYPLNYVNYLLPFNIRIIMKVIIIIIYFFCFLLEFKDNSYKCFFILYNFYVLLLFVSALLSNNDTIDIIYNKFMIIQTLMFIVYLNSKYNYQNFIKLLIIYFSLLFFIGMLGQIFFGREFIFKIYKNTNWVFIFNIILLIAISILVIDSSQMLILYFVLSILMIVQAIYNESLASFFSFLLIFVGTCLIKFLVFKKVNILLNPICSILYNILIWFFLMYDGINKHVASFVSYILGKDFDFSGRRILWDNGLKFISQNLILNRNSNKVSVINNGTNIIFYNFHNFYIDLLYDGGIITLIIFLLFLIFISYTIKKYSKVKYILISFVLMFSLLLRFQMETYSENCMFFSLALIFFMIIFNNSINKGVIYE